MIKQIVKYFLKRRNLKVWPVSPRSLSGFDFQEDIRKLIQDSAPVLFDVGASHGQTAEGWRKLFPSSHILSFEPSTESFLILKDKPIGGSFKPFKLAMGSEVSKKKFINYDHPWLNSFLPLQEEVKSIFQNPKEKEEEIVDVDTIDAFCTRNNIDRIDLLKSDTQGYDLEVLKGASSMLAASKVNHILIEMNFMDLYVGQSNSFETEAFLASHGYYLIDFYDKVRIGSPIAWCNALFGKRPPK